MRYSKLGIFFILIFVLGKDSSVFILGFLIGF